MVFDTHTTVKIDSNKRDLAKAKGLKLQDILDNALNIALGINDIDEIDATNYLIKMERITKDLKELNETKEIKQKQINELNQDIETINYKINTLEAKLKTLEKEQSNEQKEKDYIDALFNPTPEQIEQQKQKRYNALKVLYIENKGDYMNNEELKDEINAFSLTYEIEYEELINQLHNDLYLYEKETTSKIWFCGSVYTCLG